MRWYVRRHDKPTKRLVRREPGVRPEVEASTIWQARYYWPRARTRLRVAYYGPTVLFIIFPSGQCQISTCQMLYSLLKHQNGWRISNTLVKVCPCDTHRLLVSSWKLMVVRSDHKKSQLSAAVHSPSRFRDIRAI